MPAGRVGYDVDGGADDVNGRAAAAGSRVDLSRPGGSTPRLHPLNEEVVHAADMLVIVVVSLTEGEHAVKGQKVKVVLEVVVTVGHGGCEAIPLVGVVIVAKMIALVVDDVVAPLMLEDEIDESLQVALHLPKPKVFQVVRIVRFNGGTLMGSKDVGELLWA